MSERKILTLGIDLGTSAVKCVALSLAGELLGEGAAGFDTVTALPYQAEQQPQDWLRAAAQAVREMQTSDKLTPDWQRQVLAIGLTGQLPTLVCLGAHGPLGAAITWKDGRADAWTTARLDSARRALMYERTGMPIDGRYLAPMLRYHHPHRLEGMRAVLSAKDYLLWELTGLTLTEPSTAAGYGIYDLGEGRFSEGLAEYWHMPLRLLPNIRAANSLAGPLSEAGAALLGLPPGIPVTTGAADSVCASFAMAGLDARIASVSFGSSAVILGASPTRRPDAAARYLVTPHVSESWYGREMDLLSTGTGYRWLSDLFGWKNGELDRQAASSPAGARGLIFAPYLVGGEQGALWNPHLKGALLGLGLIHSRADIARAFLEGVFFEVRRCIEVLAETSPVESVVVSGKLVESANSLQMLADILDRPVGAVTVRSPAAVGAAALAGRLADLEVRAPDLGRNAAIVPHADTARAYPELYRHYLARSARCD